MNNTVHMKRKLVYHSAELLNFLMMTCNHVVIKNNLANALLITQLKFISLYVIVILFYHCESFFCSNIKSLLEGLKDAMQCMALYGNHIARI